MSFIHRDRILNNIGPFLLKLKPPPIFPSYVECIVVFAHYRWTEVLLALFVVSIFTSWFGSEQAICVNKFDRSEVSPEKKEICITYPYSVQTADDGQVMRSYALHYKWLPYAFGLALAFCCALEIFVRKFEDPKVKSLFQFLVNLKYEQEKFEKCEEFFSKYIGRHIHLPSSRTNVLLACISTNLTIFFVMNLTVAGFYLKLPLYLFTVREMQNFSDPITVTFPPFIECELAPNMQLWVDRTERIGCYLPFMEIYEKMVITLWLWQVFLLLMALKALMAELAWRMAPKSQLKTWLTVPNRPQLAARVLAYDATLGDVLLLAKVRPLLCASDFQDLVESAANCLKRINFNDLENC